MADRLESLVFDILVRDRQASEGLSKIGKAAEGAAGSTDHLTRRLNELSRKSATARVELKGDKEAQARLDKFDARLISLDRRVASPNLRIEGAARAIAELSAIDLELDKVGGKGGTAEAAASAIGSGGLAGPGGMGALIGAGAALSPVIATLGVGLGGLGLAALSVSKNTALMSKELAPLKGEFRSFSASLQPEVLGIFSEGITIARHGLAGIQPVAAATGKALGQVLTQVDREIQGNEWRQFFQFMADQAGPDIRLLGDSFTQLLHTLPAVLEDMQPVATELLTVTDNALRLTGAITNLGKSTDKTSASVGTNVGWLGFLSKAVANVTSFLHPGGVAAGALKSALDGIPASAGRAGGALGGTAGRARTLAQQLAAGQAAVNALTAAENKSLSPLLAYTNALIAQSGDAAKLNDALKKSHDRIGLKTDAERASFSAANTYIQSLLNTAAAAAKSHQNLDQVIASLQAELPRLQGAKSNTAGYTQTVQNLVGWLGKLKSIRAITEAIHVSGTGIWTVTPGKIGLPGGSAGGPFAAGGRIRAGSTETADDVLIRASRNETVVSAAHSRLLAPAFSAVGVPGYAGGGVVGTYGHLAGMGPWLSRELGATEHAIARSVAQALVSAIHSAMAGPGPGSAGGGVTRWAGTILQALGMLGQSSSWLGTVERRMNQESGGNPYAINRWDSNWRAGTPSVGLMQVIGPTYQAYSRPEWRFLHPWTYGVSENPLANTYAGLNYALHAYGSLSALNRPGGYDQGGWLMPGATLAYNGTGRPERVGGPAVVNYNTIHIHAPGGNAREIGRVLAEYLKQFQKAGGKIHP